MRNYDLIKKLQSLPKDYDVTLYDYMNNGTIGEIELDDVEKEIIIRGVETMGF